MLEGWKTDIIETLAKLFRLENYVSEKREKLSERKILNSSFLLEDCEKLTFNFRYYSISN
jgi:hypothetical protein